MKSGLSYKDAGVNIEAGSQLVESIKSIAKESSRPEVLASIGGFNSLFALGNYQEPILVSGTDGVGTKLKLADKLRKHDTIGIDLVAMCVNDVIVAGAEPLFFLDYFSTGKLNPRLAAEVIKGIGTGCKAAGCALIGGETAEMPGMYQGEDYDLAGFCVGVVEKNRLIDGSKIQPGQAIIALSSSGPHSNGYSLIRKILDQHAVDLYQPFGASTLGETLLAPTRIYAKAILQLMRQFPLYGIAHITGGGILENLPRILPERMQALIQTQSWEWPAIFHWLQRMGGIETQEMYRTFNCGAGMMIITEAHHADAAIELLHTLQQPCWKIGTITARKEDAAAIRLC